MRLFISGPMRGYPEFNKAAFEAAHQQILELGYMHPYNPHHMDAENGHDWTGCAGTDAELLDAGFNMRAAMLDNVAWIAEHGDGVVVLDGWSKSTGACAEVAFAHVMGQPIFRLADGELVSVSVLGASPVRYVHVETLPPAVDGPWPWPDEMPTQIPGQQELETAA